MKQLKLKKEQPRDMNRQKVRIVEEKITRKLTQNLRVCVCGRILIYKKVFEFYNKDLTLAI